MYIYCEIVDDGLLTLNTMLNILEDGVNVL